MSKNQLHWKKFELMILEYFNEEERWNTTMFDLSYNFNNNKWVGSIKTAKNEKNPKLWLSDARRVFSWFDTLSLHPWKTNIHLIIWVYEQIWEDKIIKTVHEFIFEDNDIIKKILYWNLSLNHVTAFHNSIWMDFFKQSEYNEARAFAKKTNEMLSKYTGIIKLHPKIDSKRQRRLQCSIWLNDLIAVSNNNSHIIYNIYHNSFLNLQLPIIIKSWKRELNHKKT